MAAPGEHEFREMQKLLRQSSGLPAEYDVYCKSLTERLREHFGVRPGFSFYDDVDQQGRDAPNALAVPYSLLPDQGPDGTVMLGVRLAKELNRPGLAGFRRAIFPLAIVMAHEFGHILQYKERVADSWEMEPHADFMAGWGIEGLITKASIEQFLDEDVRQSLAGELQKIEQFANAIESNELETSVKTMFSFGDTLFNDPGHHGEPHFRAVMVRAGFESRSLEVKKAFEKGMVWANLKR